MRIWLHVARRIISDLFSLIIKFAAVIVVIGAVIWAATQFDSVANAIGWTVFGLFCFLVLALVLALVTVYVFGVHDDVKRKLK